MTYYSKDWSEVRPDQFAKWGRSRWYFETRSDGSVVRQVEIYENGPRMRYDEAHPQNEFGRLAETRLDLGQFVGCEISAEEFNAAWEAARS